MKLDATVHAGFGAPPTDPRRIPRWHARQSIGHRAEQQDAYRTEPGFAIVADGLGGHANGAVAAQAAVSLPWRPTNTPQDYADRLVRKVNAASGLTTIVWARATSNYLEIANCGDSGAAMVTLDADGELVFQYLTEPDTLGNNVVAQCIGQDRDSSRHNDPEVTITQVPWPETTGLVLLYSDGLNGVLDHRNHMNPRRWKSAQPDSWALDALRQRINRPDLLVRWAVACAVSLSERADNATLVAGRFKGGKRQ